MKVEDRNWECPDPGEPLCGVPEESPYEGRLTTARSC